MQLALGATRSHAPTLLGVRLVQPGGRSMDASASDVAAVLLGALEGKDATAALHNHATTLLHLEALLEITMFFYAVNVIVQCATILRLRRTHPHRLRPSYTLPAPLLALRVC